MCRILNRMYLCTVFKSEMILKIIKLVCVEYIVYHVELILDQKNLLCVKFTLLCVKFILKI